MPLLLPFASITPIVYEQVEVAAGTATPKNASGVWAILAGQGGNPGQPSRTTNDNQNVNGGGGGGGAAVIERVWIPATLLGPTFQLTRGTTSNRFAQFITGGITLKAGWGNNGSGRSAGAGGLATATGIDLSGFLHDGTAGGVGGQGNSHAGAASVANTNGAATGGGGGGGSISNGSSHPAGGTAGEARGPLGKKGSAGTRGTNQGNSVGEGGDGGGGGGYTEGSGTTPGISYVKLEWA